MRSRSIRLALVAVTALLGCSGGQPPVSSQAGVARPSRIESPAQTITIIHVNDTHSHLDAIGPKDRHLDGTIGGLAKAASVIGQLEAEQPEALFIHAGDIFNEDIYFNATLGVAELRILATLGLDAVAIGNHELGLGADTLLGVLQEAFPDPGAGPTVLGANLDLSAIPALGNWVRPGVVKNVGDLHVGLFGLVTPFDPAELPAPATIIGGPQDGDTDARVAALFGAAGRAVEALRSGDPAADVVICVSHLGRDLDEALASAVPGIDAIVGGHSHDALFAPDYVPGPTGALVPIVQAGEFYKYVGRLELSFDGTQVQVAGYELVPVDASVPRAPAVTETVDGVKQFVNETFGEDFFYDPIGYALFGVPKSAVSGSPRRDSGIGDLVTDALRHAGKTDVAFTVNGFISDGMPRGFIVRDDAFRPIGDGFDPETRLGFPIFTVSMLGADLRTALETTLAAGSEDFFVQVSGMRYVFDSRSAPGSRLLHVQVGLEPLDDSRTYTVTLNYGVLVGIGPDGLNVPHGEPQPVGNEYYAVRDWVRRLVFVGYGASEGRVVDVALRTGFTRDDG